MCKNFFGAYPYTIFVTLDQLLTQCHQRCIHVAFLPFHSRGAYYLHQRLIIIDSRLSEREQLATLAHEYIHACYYHDGCQSQEVENSVNRKAAQLIIPPTEYVTAELTYGSNLYLIAEELNLPVWIVKAYRETLLADCHISAMRVDNSASLCAEDC